MDPVLVACPSCHSLVRVPTSRLAEDPKCPRCKCAVMSGTPITLDEPGFEKHAMRASFPVLVDFWAPWCGPCRMMAPALERLAGESPTRLQVGKVNSDENPSLSARFGIRGIPTLILFRNGTEVARQTGAVDYHALTRWVDNALAGTA